MAKKNNIIGDDPRTPKLMGVLLLFFATYIFVACFSYIFTWQVDQDKVNHFELDLIFQDIEVSNWLGRLGAIVSHALVFWLFGMPSFILIYILLQYGLGIINDIPLSRFGARIRTALGWMLGLSILMGFFFYKFDFPWGGNFGRSISDWLIHAVGVVGTFLLILLIISFLIIWSYNPELSGLTFANFFEQLKLAVLSLWDDRYKNKTFDIAEKTRRLADMPTEKTEKPKPSTPSVSLAPLKAGEKSVIEEALAPKPSVETPTPAIPPSIEENENGAYDLTTKNQTSNPRATPSLKVGEGELEIEIAPPLSSDLGDIMPQIGRAHV